MILDIQMPVLDGLSAAEQIAAARIAPVIVLTAFSQRELVERARDAGAMAYLVKPFSKNDLVPAIEVAVRRFAEMTALDGEVPHARGAAGDPQGRREGQGPAHGGAGHDRGRGLPVDPADGDEPAHLDEGARRVDPGAGPGGGRSDRGGLTAPGPVFVTRSEPFTPPGHVCPPIGGHVFITERLTGVHA